MRLLFFVLLLTFGLSGGLLAQNEKVEVLRVAQSLLDAIESGDTTAFRAVFLPSAMIHTVREKNGQAVSASRSAFADTFRPDVKIRERMKNKGVQVEIKGNIAQVWAPYDLWVNDKFSHCGTDVFTLLKTAAGWKVATLSYSIETEGCNLP